ncbi:MAG TPA: glycosyltransferase [Longimicrobium sp.]|nr:glycosyltransferase [Longimicrobium sp.]
MIFIDINTFFAERAGGIRTYHAAKLEWFARQRRHHYHLVCPGPRHRVRELGPNVTITEVYGPSLGRRDGGYRLMLDYPRVFSLLRELGPDVVEAGDPWLTGLFCLALARPLAPVVSAFYHGDPIRTWVEPWAAAPGRLEAPRRLAASAAARAFYALQRRYRVTMVSSPAMERHLRGRGVDRVACVPFGTDPRFARARRPHAAPGDGARRLLYAGRLGREKGADLLLAALPRLLQDPRVSVTVMGRGELEEAFAAFAHPRYRFAGFVADRGEVARVFGEHDVMLAPGPHETFGLSVLEALEAGLAVVGPDAGGTAERLRALDDPFLFRAGDVDDFVRATFRAAAADPEAAARQAARAAAAYPSWDAAVGRMVEVYESVAEAAEAERQPESLLTHA